MKKLIVVADWSNDSLETEKVRTTVEGFLKDPTAANITFVSSGASSIHTAFMISQMVYTEESFGRPVETVIYQGNSHIDKNVQSTQPQDLTPVVIKLKSGIYLIGPNAGYSFSLIKDQIDEVWEYSSQDSAGNMDLHTLCARLSAHLMDSLDKDLPIEEVGVDAVPDLQGYYVGHIDSEGKIFTTVSLDDLKGKYEYGNIITVTINGVKNKVRYTAEEEFTNDLVMYPTLNSRRENPFMVIKSAMQFNSPKPGMKIELV